MALVTKMLGIAINDRDAGRITTEALLSIFQEAIDNGDILEEENELSAMVAVIPLVDRGVLKPSIHTDAFISKMNARMIARASELREKHQRRWWQFWKS